MRFLVCSAVFRQTVKVNSNAKAQFSKYKTSSWKASTNPGNPLGIMDVKKKVWCGEGRERWSTSQRATRKDADEVKKIVVKMFQRFPPK